MTRTKPQQTSADPIPNRSYQGSPQQLDDSPVPLLCIVIEICNVCNTSAKLKMAEKAVSILHPQSLQRRKRKKERKRGGGTRRMRGHVALTVHTVDHAGLDGFAPVLVKVHDHPPRNGGISLEPRLVSRLGLALGPVLWRLGSRQERCHDPRRRIQYNLPSCNASTTTLTSANLALPL